MYTLSPSSDNVTALHFREAVLPSIIDWPLMMNTSEQSSGKVLVWADGTATHDKQGLVKAVYQIIIGFCPSLEVAATHLYTSKTFQGWDAVASAGHRFLVEALGSSKVTLEVGDSATQPMSRKLSTKLLFA